MATSGKGAIITRGQLVSKFLDAYWKNKTLPTTTSDNRCASADWIKDNLDNANYTWQYSDQYTDAAKLVQAAHCFDASSNYITPNITYTYALSLTTTASSSDVYVNDKLTYTAILTTKTYTGGVHTDTKTEDVTSACTWTSSSTGNATVSNGVVSAKKGKDDNTETAVKVTITATHARGSATANVNVKDKITTGATSSVAYSDFEITPAKATISAGSSTTISGTILKKTTPITIYYKNGGEFKRENGSVVNTTIDITDFTISSSNTGTATVNGKTVSGVAAKYGSTTITGTTGSTYGSLTDTCTVNVTYSWVETSYAFSINTTSKTVTNDSDGETFTITPTVTKTEVYKTDGSTTKTDITYPTGTYEWSSSNTDIATVSGGTVTVKAKKYGSVNITCKETKYTGVTKTCTTTVNYTYTTTGNVTTYKNLSISPSVSTIDKGTSTKSATITGKATKVVTPYTYYHKNGDAVTSSTAGTPTETANTTVTNFTIASNKTWATVSGKTVTAASTAASHHGTATITATGDNTYTSGGSTTCTITVDYTYSTITKYVPSLTATSTSIDVGKTSTLTYNYYYEYSVYKNDVVQSTGNKSSSQTVGASSITWSSADKSIATVSGGTVTGVKGKNNYTSDGNAVVIKGSHSTYGEASITINVKDVITTASGTDYAYSNFKIAAAKTSITAGSSTTISGTVTETATPYTLYYINGGSEKKVNGTATSKTISTTDFTIASNNTAVATVSGKTVSGVSKKYGTVTITGTAGSTYAGVKGKTATASVTVNYSYTKSDTYTLSIDTSSKTVTNTASGTSFTITPKVTRTVVTCSNGVDSTAYTYPTGTYTWSSSNTAVATVSGGKVTVIGAKYGSTTITCKETALTGASKTCAVTVNYTYTTTGNIETTYSNLKISANNTTIDAGTSTKTATISGTVDKTDTKYTYTYTNGVYKSKAKESASTTNISTTNFTISSSNTSVATVSGKTVTAVANKWGSVTITGTGNSTIGTSLSATVGITVNYTSERKHSIEIPTTTYTLSVPNTQQIGFTLYNIKTVNGVDSGSKYAVSTPSGWSGFSSNSTANATVSSTGLVTAVLGKNDGTEDAKAVTITGSYGNDSKTVTVNVKDVITTGNIKSGTITVPMGYELYAGETKNVLLAANVKRIVMINGVASDYTQSQYINSGTSFTYSSSSAANATMALNSLNVPVITAIKGKNDYTENVVPVTITVTLKEKPDISATIPVNVKDKITTEAAASTISYKNLSIGNDVSVTVNGTAKEKVAVTGTVTKVETTNTIYYINGANGKTFAGTTTESSVNTTNFTLTSSKPAIASISGKTVNVATRTTGGAVTITATGGSTIGTSLTASFTLNVTCRWHRLTVNPSSLSIVAGKTGSITSATMYAYVNGTQQSSTGTPSCSWTTSNTAVATLSSTSGKSNTVRGVSAGTATITATASGPFGSCSGTCSVTVTQPARGKINISHTMGGVTSTSLMGYSSTNYSGSSTITAVNSFIEANPCTTLTWINSSTTVGTLSNSTTWKTGYYYAAVVMSNIMRLVKVYVSAANANSLNAGNNVGLIPTITTLINA